MSFANLLQSAATQAQSTLAQLQGLAPGSRGNTLFAGATSPLTGVYGQPVTQLVPQPGGGYRQRTFLPLTITRTSLPVPPAVKSRLVRLDLTPPETYIIDHVVHDRALDWEFHLVRFGA